MRGEIHRLTLTAIMDASKVGRHPDGGGLYLQVSPSGGRSWLFRYQGPDGKDKWMGLGAVDLTRLADSLATARRRATEARERLAGGEDPLEHKRAAAASLDPAKPKTFRECASEYLAKHSPAWKSRVHRDQWYQTLDAYVYPVIGKLPVGAVDIEHVQKILEPIWTTKDETARRIRGRLEMILDFGTVHRYRSGDNPARMSLVRQMLGKRRSPQKHHPAMPYQQLPGFIDHLAKRDDTASLALYWAILTASRSAEARGTTWDELDLKNKLWVIPPLRMKRDREHRVPISFAALGLIKRVKRRGVSPYVFPGQDDADPISDTALRNVLRKLGITKDMASVHGFRSTFRDWAAENSIEDPVAESCLAHSVPDKVVAAYRRTTFLTLRTEAMERWALFLA